MNHASAAFFQELDRRIDSPDSVQDQASRQRLRLHRITLAILAANDPDRFESAVRAAITAVAFRSSVPSQS